MPTGSIDTTAAAWHASLQEFGQQLRHRRECVLRLTQTQLAARAGNDQSGISRIEAGRTPRDKAAALALADAYRLSAAETQNWLDLLYGRATVYINGKPAACLTLEDVYALLERLRGDRAGPRGYDYFNPDRRDPGDEEVIAAVDWLLADSRRLPRAHLLVEFAAVLMHRLNGLGQYRRRLALALAAADAAAALERRTVEGWLRSDAIPWTLMEQGRDAAAARAHLERGLALAGELKNRDMAALALAFLGRASLIDGDNRRAGGNLSRARRHNASPPVQMRIDWIDGDLARRQKRYDRAFALYHAAAAVDVSHSGGYHSVVTPLFRLGELHLLLNDGPAAKETYAALLADTRPPLSGIRLGQAQFSLARIARREGNVAQARRHAEQARMALATADDNPQLRQVIGRFVGGLER